MMKKMLKGNSSKRMKNNLILIPSMMKKKMMKMKIQKNEATIEYQTNDGVEETVVKSEG